MTITTLDPPTQVGTTDTADPIALARVRFSNLRATGILPPSATGPAIDPGDLEAALAFLSRCRRNKRPSIFTYDLQRHVSRWAGRQVSTGAIIAAAVALDFQVHGWYGVRAFHPNALTNVGRFDLREGGAMDVLTKRETFQSDDLRNLPPALERLVSLPNWVCWKWKWKQPKGGKDGKWDKPPYMSESPGMMAESNRASTWSSHDLACKALESRYVDGIGFVIFGTDICAFDIDDCRNPKTGEIDPIAMSLVNRANSYTEITVSGTGLRIIGIGSDRYMNRKQKIDGSKVSIESYRNCERYITISGMVLDGTSLQLTNIDSLIDEVVVELTPQTEPPETQDKKPETIDPVIGEVHRGFAFLESSLPPLLRDLVSDGVPDTEDRSAAFHHAVKWLKDCTWSLPDIITLLTQYPEGIARKYGPRLAGEAQRCFDKPDGVGANTTETDEKKQNSRPGIPLAYYGKFGTTAAKAWILKGVVARGETSSWIAPPSKGKSALITDIAIHIASGEDWRGYRCKERCGVVYFALERAALVKRRLMAHAQRTSVNDLPIAVASQIIDLSKSDCIAAIVATIHEAEAHFGCAVGMIVVDTYSKGIAAGGGDENSAKDQNMTLGNLRRVQEETGVHVALVGHTGKEEDRGARGSNAHLADVDMMVQIKGDKDSKLRTAEIVKNNDGPEGVLTRFELEIAVLGEDEDGDDITTAILSEDTFDSEEEIKQAKMNKTQRRAMELLERCIVDAGKPAPVTADFPQGIGKVVSIDTWRTTCIKGSLSAGNTESSERVFRRAMTDLISMHKIATWENWVWIAYE
jgi:hypothetical protein